ncbi:hypothetical protein GCM10022222_11990 [Amycolatopsis ultiminotia]|uniref:Uncharacterized protein n=1 Tax=Amycolatopsis ultiminotia TaxID=543629 RepID=A0ABP6VCT1_9PSEU
MLIHTQQHNATAGTRELGTPGETGFTARGVDHDVVGACRRAGFQAFRGNPLMLVAHLDIDVEAALPGRGQQPDAATADDRHPLPLLERRAADTVHGHRRRLHEAGVAHVEAGRELDEHVLRNRHGITYAAVSEHAERSVLRGAAPLDVAGPALIALAAVNRGFDGVGPAVGGGAGELVAIGVALNATRREVDVGPAEAGRGDGEANPGTFRLVDLGHEDALIGVSYGTHGVPFVHRPARHAGDRRTDHAQRRRGARLHAGIALPARAQP